MIHGKGRVYANAMLVHQVDGSDIKYRSPEEEEEEEEEEEQVSSEPRLGSPRWDSFSTGPAAPAGDCRQNRRPASPRGGESGARGPESPEERSPRRSSPPAPFASSPSFPSSPLASAFRSLEGAPRRPALPVSPALNQRGCSLTEASRGLSPSLECDSGEDDILGHSYPCAAAKKQFVLRSSSREERDSFDASPDFNRTLSDSSHTPAKVHTHTHTHTYIHTHTLGWFLYMLA
ncbi:hypothetical protein EYF80_060389 [Liparis tanakae]|uniref:Uncharacterized protein n=1 Tax=Liparis tanakae TaxID=230148 RepID=A0A4Z2EKV6_9TELE|nr:hypothetical protein EYF80_060389 [Liparis tanakae]